MVSRTRLLTIALMAVVLLVPAGIPAGATEPAPEISLKAANLDGHPELAKVSQHLLEARRLTAAGVTTSQLAQAVPVLRFVDDQPLIEIRFDELTASTIKRVETIGFRSAGTYPELGVMVGLVDLGRLDELAAIAEVAVIHPEYGAVRSVGATTSQADVSIRADLARSEFSVDGTGVTVGVISDSFNDTLGGSVGGSGCNATVTGMANQLSGDLPAAVKLLDNGTGGLSDEGAAMGELITDLAPGADLMFHSAWPSRAAFAAGITQLKDCGADVIVDDIIYFAEPMFQDGLIAQAAQDAVDAGVPFFSSAGNQGTYGVSQTYLDSNPGTDDLIIPATGDDLHDFGGGDRFASVTVPAGAGVRFVLQWTEPYAGTLGPGSAIDMDLLLFSAENPASPVLAFGADVQGCSTGARSGDPLEILEYTNLTGSPQIYYLAVEHFCGSEAVDFRIASYGAGSSITALTFEPAIFNDAQIYGHAAAEGVAAVGAVYYPEIDSGGSFAGGAEINVELFSSLGGNVPFHFDNAGDPLPGAPVTRFKPEIAAPDGTNNTFFGADSDGDAFPNFFGTSAAAPHAAAVAALMLELKPGLAPHQVLSALRTSAVDIESAGPDTLSGDGLIDARDALATSNTIDVIAPTWPGGSAISFSNVTETSARVTWTAAADNVSVASYRVYVNGSFWGAASATFIDLAGLTVGSVYSIRVEAVDAVGNESAGGPAATLVTADSAPPTWPGGSAVNVTDVTTTSVTISWGAATDNGTVASYNVYLDGLPVGGTASTTMALTGLTGGVTYTVAIEAVDAVGNESTGGPTTTFATVNPGQPGGSFADDNGNIHEGNIEAIAAAGITKGCNPPTNDLYCPGSDVTRGQMAAFMVRALGLTDDGGGNSFVDDDGSIFENDIAKLAAAGITRGCNPPVNDSFCPNEFVTRGQMAAFMVRALGLTDDGGGNSFVDDDGSIFENDIAKLAAAGITRGCNPPVNDSFCPNDRVKRDQMASFLARALSLSPITPPALQTFGDGIWMVPAEVPAGIYRNSDSSGGCFWARLSGLGGTTDDTITNEFTYEIDIVTVVAGDVGFESSRCGTWTNQLTPRTSSPAAAFGGGAFLVGSEVSAGTWRNSDSTAGCYWERLNGFRGTLPDIIVNSFSSVIQTVTIDPSDKGFFSEGCGTWTKVG